MIPQPIVRFFPFLAWWPLSVLLLRGDLIAGLIGALVLAPKAIAYAQLAGLPLQCGLYTAFVPAVIAALWGSSRHLSTGPVAILALMSAAAVAPLALPGSEDYIGLVLLLSLMVGCIQVVLGLVKIGNAVHFVSHPVVLGFINASALIIGFSQLDMLLGIPKGQGDFFLKQVWEMLSYLPLTHLPTLVMSLCCLLAMLVAKRISWLAQPGLLLVVALSVVVSAVFGFEHNKIAQITEIATPEARGIVATYMATAQRMTGIQDELARLNLQVRQAEKAQDARLETDLRYRFELLDLDFKTLESENRNRMRTLHRLYFVCSSTDSNNAARFYRLGTVPEGIHTEPQHWRIKKITPQSIQFMGGGDVVGSVPAGLPGFRLPSLSSDAVLQLMSAALVIALVGFMQAISIAKVMARKTKQHLDPNQELIGQGLANIGGAFFQSYPVCGSFTASIINFQAGARSGVAMLCNGLCMALIALFFTPLMHHLPKAVLAVTTLLAVSDLVTPSAFKHTWKASRVDGMIALVTCVVTLLAAPHLDKGIMIGALLSIGHHLYRTMAPHVAILGRYEDGTLRDVKHHDHLVTSTKLVVIRFDGSLYFANIAHFEDAVLAAIATHKEARFLLVVGDAINSIDSSGEEMLHSLVAQLRQVGVNIVFSGLKKQVIDVMQATGLLAYIGTSNTFATEDQALAAIAVCLGEEGSENGLFCRL